MAVLVINKNILAVTCGLQTITVCLDDETFHILEPPSIKGENADKAEEKNGSSVKDVGPAPAHVVCADLSTCNKWLVLCSNNKQLSLWTTHNWSLLSNRVLARTASKVKFTRSGRAIVVADKSGDAYLYSVENPNEGSGLLLGHLSMLLDVVITSDEKYIITCDRDEKIRVSRFPNAYNIQSYCLGHTQFVTGISLLPHCLSVLISCSGDGSLRFWDYLSGSQLNVIDCNEDVNPNHENSHVNNPTDKNDGSLVVPSSKHPTVNRRNSDVSDILPVTKFTSTDLDQISSLICVCISGFTGCMIYKVSGGTTNITSSLLQVLSLNVEPWDIILDKNKVLWSLAPIEKEPLQVFTFDTDTYQFGPDLNNCKSEIVNAVTLVNNKWELFKGISAPALTPVLYKRKFDNIQEYQERKKLRLGLAASTGSS